ncbi:hypothetical protein P7C71_g5987, partial [Lecanoromycetidae sp. Uapishka_2]
MSGDVVKEQTLLNGDADTTQVTETHKQLSFLIIGAGSRGNAYASALNQCDSLGSLRVGAIAEPIESKRLAFKRKYVRHNETCQLYETWQQFVEFENERRKRESDRQDAGEAVDGVFVCVLDEMHAEIITALAPLGMHIMSNAAWPVNVVDPEIEDMMTHGKAPHDRAMNRLMERLEENYDSKITPTEEIQARPWFGRCVYGSDNNVCDDQVVTITWNDDPLDSPDEKTATKPHMKGRGAKIATFHMVASTEKQCERRGRIYGTKGEIEYDSKTIRVFDFATNKAEIHHPLQRGGGHGGGDAGLAQQFVRAIEAVERGVMSVDEAQRVYVGCTLEEVIRSHAMVFAAEDARKGKRVVDWGDWWRDNVESVL